MTFYDTLPFSGGYFFSYLIVSTVLVWSIKRFFPHLIEYKKLLSVITIGYIATLFTKPLQLLALIGLLYLFLWLLRKYYRYENVILPMVILALPMFLMKVINLFPVEGQNISCQGYKRPYSNCGFILYRF